MVRNLTLNPNAQMTAQFSKPILEVQQPQPIQSQNQQWNTKEVIQIEKQQFQNLIAEIQSLNQVSFMSMLSKLFMFTSTTLL